ncbi:discoidin domain-containing protein [Rheinheimera sp. NSM]|uniref:discoidin domain-containing protein n=1 Tax=Rheinheimera sp. NSM TaxID=3457884 RepID=UPI00403645D3
MKTLPQRQLLCALAAALAVLTGCDSGKDPDVNNAPTPVSTSAQLNASAVKGLLTGASVSVSALNGTAVSSTAAQTDSSGMAATTLTSAPGYAFSGVHKLTVTTTADSSMLCDLSLCGAAALGTEVGADALGTVALSNLFWLKAPLGATADGTADATVQVNALTTFAGQLLEAAIAGGRNVSALATLEPAQLEYSAQLLRILGVDIPAINLMQQPLHSADNAENFAQSSNQLIRLSFVNAAFAHIGTEATLADTFAAAAAQVTLAADGDAEAATALRQQLLDALQGHPVLAELGLAPDSIIDLELPLVVADNSSGPIREYTTAAFLTGAQISYRGAISDSESGDQAFDGSLETKWLDNTAVPTAEAPAWLTLQFAQPQAISMLSISSANDAPDRDPENFNLQASNDGESWFTLGQWAGISFEQRFAAQDFAFNNSLPYRYYRLNVTKNKGDTNLMQLAEVQLFGPVYAEQIQQGGSISARGAIGDAERAEMAFDGLLTTKWLDNTAVPSAEQPSWVQVQFSEAKAVSSLAISSANDAPERDPENFNLQASNDGVNWLTLGEWAGESFDSRGQRRLFSTNNSLAYLYYRLNITKNKGDNSLMQIAEIELIGPAVPALNHALTATAVTSSGAISDAEAADYAFDGDSQTKWLDNTAVPTADAPAWASVALAEPQAVNMLALVSANDAPERDPENFSLLASNDGEYWVNLGQWAGISFNERAERQTFAVANSLGYGHYRLDISKNKGDNSLMQVAEIELIGPQVQAQDHSDNAAAQISARAAISDGEAGTMAFDNNPATKWLDNGGVPSLEAPSWLEISLPAPVIVNTFALTSANDAPERDPENFRLLGSNDGDSWQVLADWAGESFAERAERRSFSLLNGRSFSHYRIEISKNKGDNSLMQVAEFELIGPVL